MPLARASELDRLLACAGSGFLPREDLRSDFARGAAAWGDVVHAWVETGALPEDAKTRKMLEERIVLSGISRGALWPEGGLHEVALAYNVVSGAVDSKRDGTKEEKDAWKAHFGDEWVTGSADYVSDVFGEPWVDDLKTGRRVTWGAYKAQQSLYALTWSKVCYGEVRRARSSLTHWPRYPKHNPPDRFGRVLDVDYLNNYAVELRSLRDRILRGRAVVATDSGGLVKLAVLSVGEHCGYCPSRNACPVVGEATDPNALGSF